MYALRRPPSSSGVGVSASIASADQTVYVTGTYKSLYGLVQYHHTPSSVGGFMRGLRKRLWRSSQVTTSAVIAGANAASTAATSRAAGHQARWPRASSGASIAGRSDPNRRTASNPPESAQTESSVGAIPESACHAQPC